MPGFENIADEIIRNSMMRREEQARREQLRAPAFQPVKKVIPPPIPSPDYGPAVRQAFEGAGQAVSGIVAGVMEHRDEWAADRERIDLIRKAYWKQEDKIDPTTDEIITVSIPLDKDLENITNQIENTLKSLGSKKQELRTNADPNNRQRIKNEIRGIEKTLSAQKANLNEIAPKKSDLMDLLERSAKEQQVYGRRAIGGEKKEEEPKPVTTFDNEKTKILSSIDSLYGEVKSVPMKKVAGLLRTLVDNATIIPSEKIGTTRATELSIQNMKNVYNIGRRIIDLGEMATPEDMFNGVIATVQEQVNDIVGGSESPMVKGAKLTQLMNKYKEFLNPKVSGELFLQNYLSNVLGINDIPEGMLSSPEAGRNFINDSRKAIQESLTAENKKAFEGGVKGQGQRVLNTIFAGFSDLGIDLSKNFGEDQVGFITGFIPGTKPIEQRLREEANVGRAGISDYENLTENAKTFFRENFGSSLPAEGRIAVSIIKNPTQNKEQWEAIKTIGILEGIVSPSMTDEEMRNPLISRFGNNWQAYYAKYVEPQPTPTPTPVPTPTTNAAPVPTPTPKTKMQKPESIIPNAKTMDFQTYKQSLENNIGFVKDEANKLSKEERERVSTLITTKQLDKAFRLLYDLVKSK